MTVLERLARLCASWGGSLRLVSQNEYTDLFEQENARRLGWSDSPAASWHGVNYSRKTVYSVPGHENPGTIIHEMGHVFADPKGKVEDTDEWAFLGWEIATARYVRCFGIWSEQNKHYCLGDGFEAGDWGGLSRSEMRKLSAERIAHAKKIGLVSKTGKPLSIR